MGKNKTGLQGIDVVEDSIRQYVDDESMAPVSLGVSTWQGICRGAGQQLRQTESGLFQRCDRRQRPDRGNSTWS